MLEVRKSVDFSRVAAENLRQIVRWLVTHGAKPETIKKLVTGELALHEPPQG